MPNFKSFSDQNIKTASCYLTLKRNSFNESRYTIKSGSYLAGVLLGESLVPENHGPLAQVVIIADGLALLFYPLLGTVLK